MNINEAQERVQFNEEESEIWDDLWAFYTRVPTLLDAGLKAEHGLDHAEFFALHQLAVSEEDRLSMSQLAQRTHMSLSHLSRVVTRLEGKGLVQRVPHPLDGRVTLTELTDAGRGIVRSAFPDYVDQVRRLFFDHLAAGETRQVGTVLKKLTAALDTPPSAPTTRPVPAETS